MRIHTFLIIAASMLCVMTSCASDKVDGKKQTSSNRIVSTDKNEAVAFSVNIFIENSGSMQGYFKGQDFQMEIGSLITGLQQSESVKDLRYYYINKSIHKGSDKSEEFIRYLASNANVGNTASTNIGELIEKVSDSTYVNDNSVSILISDFIISPGSKNAASVSASEINKISGVSNKLADKKYAVAFYRMLVSDFTGKYYDCDDKPKILTKEKRPYFMMIIGGEKFVKAFQGGIAPKIVDMNNDKAFTDSQCFFKLDTIKVNFKFPKDIGFRICPKRNKLCIHEDKYNLKIDKEGNKVKCFTFNIEADSKSFPKLLSSSYIKDRKNYKLDKLSEDDAVIEKIYKEKGKYKFRIKLKSTRISKNDIRPNKLTLKLILQNPAWIEKYNISDCSEIFSEGNEEKTYGLEYITRGMFSTFYKKKEFTIAEIRINNCKNK